MNTTILILALGLPLMLVMRVPLAFAIGLATIGALWSADIDMMSFAERMVSGTQSFSLLAIPFFILAGDLMTSGGISRRLVGFADVLVRHRTGGLGMVAVLAAAFFAALSGSAPATTAAIGVIMIPEMEKRGYSRAFATALAVAGGIIGPMLPRSIPMVVWGVMSETSISQLFLAGVVPGILLALGLMALCWHHARKHDIAPQPKASRAEVWAAFNAAKWALCGPVLVLGGIYGGIVTPTEAAIVAAIFALERHMAMTVASWFEIPDIVANSDLIAIAPRRLFSLDPRLRNLKASPLPLEEVVFSFDLCWDLRTEREPGQKWLRKVVSDVFKGIRN